MNSLTSAQSPLNSIAVRRAALATTLNRRAQLASVCEIARRAATPRRLQMSHAAPVQVVDDVTFEKGWTTPGLSLSQAEQILSPGITELPIATARAQVQRLQFETIGLCVTLASIVVTFAVLMLA